MALCGPDSVYAMPAASRFADSLARGLRTCFADPMALAQVQVFLPNRRAMRALSEALLRQTDGKALILPRLRALGDVGDEDLDLLSGGSLPDLPPPLSAVDRLLAMVPLVAAGLAKMYDRQSSFAEALRYTRALLRLFDQLQYGGISRPDILALKDGGEFAGHWDRMLAFLDIALDYWPRYLAERGASDPVAWRMAHLAALTQQWDISPPPHPVVAAGSTGTITGVRQLLRRISLLPQGCVVLPSLPLDAAHIPSMWATLAPTHPAFALKQLIDALDRTPDSIAPWPHATAPDCSDSRVALIHRAFVPAAFSYLWRDESAAPDSGQHLRVLDAAHPAEEAGAIALAMRAVLDTPGRTCALVTPDRMLARRVTEQLNRFEIAIDDSAGTPLAQSRPATFLLLLCDLGLQACAPVPLLALLKHPLAHGTLERGAWLAQVRQLDAHVLRGPRPSGGLAGLQRAAAGHASLTALLATLHAGLQAWLAAHHGSAQPLAAWIALHSSAAESLAGEALWAHDAGRAVQALLQQFAASSLPLTAAEYALLLRDALQAESLRPVFGRHPRLFIWGPLEARLQRCDVMILAGLNETVWPAPADIDPVFNDAMRQKLGLPTTEFRIGQSAMDFVHGLCAPEVLLSRARKSDDTPTIASRFLQRLDTAVVPALARADDLLAAARGLDLPEAWQTTEEPLPVPPLALRPRTLFVTDIERLRRNPYALYARKILGLVPLDALDPDPDAADRGNRIHDALESYYKSGTTDLLAHFRRAFADLWDRPQVQVLWMPRLRLIADWIAAQTTEDWIPRAHETDGAWTLPGLLPAFTVRGRADRIDLARDGQSLRLIDYKTGQPPTSAQIAKGYALQLPLLAHIAEQGGFADVAQLPVSALEVWELKGSEAKAGKVHPLFSKDRTAVMQTAWDTLLQLIALFDREETAYRFKSGPQRGGGTDYNHLARVDAWQGRKP